MSVCGVLAGCLVLSGCLGFGSVAGEELAIAAPQVAARRPGVKPKVRPIKKPTKKKRRILRRKNKKKKPSNRRPADPPPSDPPPADPPQGDPPITCSDGECGPLVGITAAHNAARAAVGVAPLVWDDALHQNATDWAQQLAANGCYPLAHQSNNAYGENLYWNSAGGSASTAVAAWTAEKANYDHENNTCTQGICGHYTQVVWAASRRIGCGVASCGSQRVWVCEYDPRGNYHNQRPY